MIFDGNKGCGEPADAENANERNNQADDDDHPCARHCPGDESDVIFFAIIIGIVEGSIEGVALLKRNGRLKPERALCRLQCGGVQRADQRGCGDDHGKLRQHFSGEAGQESRRQKHRHQHQRDADDRTEELTHGAHGSVMRAEPLFDIFADGLHDHDGVVDDNANGQNNAKQRRQVHRIAQRIHADKGADNRDGNGCRRHKRGAEVLQKNQNDDQHQKAGLIESVIHLIDRLINENGRIERDAILHILGEALRQLRHLLFDRLADLQRVGFRRLEDGDASRGPVVDLALLRIGLRTELDAGDILNSDQPAAISVLRLDDDFGELGRVIKPRKNIDRVLKVLIGRGRRHARLPGRDKLALLGDRLDHILRHEPEGVELARIHPYAHGVFGGAKHCHIGDAGQTRQLIDEVNRGVIAQE